MNPQIFLPSGTCVSWYYVGNGNNLHTTSIMILSIGISIENMFKRFCATLRHYALIITKFNHTCMVYIADRVQKHCTLCMHNEVLITRAHFVLSIVLYVLYTFLRQYKLSPCDFFVSVFDRSLLPLTNRNCK